MGTPVCEVLLTPLPLAVPAEVCPDETGAVLDFWGVVRLTEQETEITGLDYEAHRTMAEHQLRLLAEEGARLFELQRISIRHRTGFVPVGEPSLLVRVASRHRAAAFQAAKWVVDELKQRVPIWKRPRRTEQPAAAVIESTSGRDASLFEA
jgi:molybdopterin synthase catalytic subunit